MRFCVGLAHEHLSATAVHRFSERRFSEAGKTHAICMGVRLRMDPATGQPRVRAGTGEPIPEEDPAFGWGRTGPGERGIVAGYAGTADQSPFRPWGKIP